jgi:hypothetical protein
MGTWGTPPVPTTVAAVEVFNGNFLFLGFMNHFKTNFFVHFLAFVCSI